MYDKTCAPIMPESDVCTDSPRMTICDMAHTIRGLSFECLDTIISIRNVITMDSDGIPNDCRSKDPSCLMDEMEHTIEILKHLCDELRSMQGAVG